MSPREIRLHIYLRDVLPDFCASWGHITVQKLPKIAETLGDKSPDFRKVCVDGTSSRRQEPVRDSLDLDFPLGNRSHQAIRVAVLGDSSS